MRSGPIRPWPLSHSCPIPEGVAPGPTKSRADAGDGSREREVRGREVRPSLTPPPQTSPRQIPGVRGQDPRPTASQMQHYTSRESVTHLLDEYTQLTAIQASVRISMGAVASSGPVV